MRKLTRGQKVIRFIETYCLVPEGAHVGKPIKLEKFQKDFILAVYDNKHGTEKAILSIGRKNGKTALIAALLLAHLVGPEAKQNSQIVSGAMSRDQAALVFALACKMINLNPDLQAIVHIIPSGKKLHGLPMNTEYKALAAEGKTAQGAHEHPLLIAISTQAADDADLLSIWIDDALNSQDPHIVCHVYAADKEAGIMDKKAWKAANPALGKFRSLRDLEKLAENAARMPSAENTFRNLNLNQRVSTDSPFVSIETWKSCGGEAANLRGMAVYGGLDLSARTDLTAFVLVGRDETGNAHVRPYFWTPREGLFERAKRDRAPYDVWAREGFLRTTPGATVDYSFVVSEIAEIVADIDLQAVAFDRWRIDIFRQELQRAGINLTIVEHEQGFKDMSPAIDALEADLLNSKLRHSMHPVLNMCALNATVLTDPAGNRKFVKQKQTGRIDGMVALAMAMSAANKADAPPISSEQLSDFIDNMVIL